jgi:hypothetical protein
VLENGSAAIAQIKLSSPETAFDLVCVREAVAAKPKGIGRARGSLLRRSTIVLGERSGIADAGCDQHGRGKIAVRHIHLFLISLCIDRQLGSMFTEREHGLVNVVA